MASLTSSASAAPASTAENAIAKPIDRIVTPLGELVSQGNATALAARTRARSRRFEGRDTRSPGHARLGEHGAPWQRIGVVSAQLERARNRIFEVVHVEHILHRQRPE